MIKDIDFEQLHFHHFTPIQVRYGDIDMMNHVNNSVQTSYCDIARMEYFDEVFQMKIARTEESLIIGGITVDFIRSIFMNEHVNVQNKIIEIGNKSIVMAQQIVNSESQEVKTRIITALVAYDHIKLQAISIPEKWKNLIDEFEGGVKYKYGKK
jgi:acyl-CoA thioester hydrolase